jgi:hypothetical protein
MISSKRQRSDPGHPPPGIAEAIVWFVLLVIRGLLLWLVIPLAFVLWLLISPARVVLHRPYATLGKVIGWADLNLTAAIAQILIRPFGRRISFIQWSSLLSVNHRVSLIDPW